jgi:hypothetical protein
MSKKVLAIYYSQSGQLGEIIDSFISPLIEDGIPVEKVRIKPEGDFTFPWTADRFFSVMPACVLDRPIPLVPFTLKESEYDLIILGYQAWFLSPSIPFNSLFQQAAFKSIIKNTPIITITGARNMWLNAFVRVKKLIHGAGAKLVGNIALVDKHPNPVSFVTIFHWKLHGKKGSFGIFPPAGVSDTDIANTKIFGATALPYLKAGEWAGLQEELASKRAFVLKYNLMFIESLAGHIFSIWAKFIIKRKNQAAWLRVFKYYLVFALFAGAPVALTLHTIFYKPFAPKRIKAKKQYYLGLN